MNTPTEAHEKLYNEIFKLVYRELFEDYDESSTGPATQLIADSEARATAERACRREGGVQKCATQMARGHGDVFRKRGCNYRVR